MATTFLLRKSTLFEILGHEELLYSQNKNCGIVSNFENCVFLLHRCCIAIQRRGLFI